eukprot:TRINITY_DN1002_c0_g1_i1.p2 TRINITY_DN1002_c0_g1~~TRINITY_DN1002_c0_g1_i1.p2  ORF type:complete len:474 (+),score=212.20 TRINITY_DN1002_c0_g1_i1:117-1424(+)
MSHRAEVLASHMPRATVAAAQTAGRGTQICVCGGGNAAHVMVCDLTLRGYSVNLYAPFADEAARFKRLMPAQGIKINYTTDKTAARSPCGKVGYAKPNKVSKSPADVVPGSKYIFIPLPVFAHEPTLNDIVPHCDSDAMIIAMPATGCFDWTATKVMKKYGKQVRIGGIAPLPYVCRAVSYAKEINLMGIKDYVGMATLPSSLIRAEAPIIKEILHIGVEVEMYPSFVPVTLTPTNPIMHTGRLYGMFVAAGYWRDRPGYPGMIKFYDDCDDISNEWLHRLNAENRKVAAALEAAIPGCTVIDGKSKIRDINMFLKWAYGPDITKWDTCGDCYRTNKQFHGVGSPMKEVAPGYWVPDFTNRYFQEDMPFGLMANKGLAELFGVPTPGMDAVIEWIQSEMGKKYLVNGKVNGAEKPQMSPQAFGYSKDDIIKMYKA